MPANHRSQAMQPSRAGTTRTAPPRPPDRFPGGGRYPAYLAFGACGFFLLSIGLLIVRVVWVLGQHDPAAWVELMRGFANPIYLIYHGVAFVAMVWFALRLFRLFPATQPPRLGPLPRPPAAVLVGALTGLFGIVSLLFFLVLWGALP